MLFIFLMWKGIIVNQLPFNVGCRNVSIISNNTSICKQKCRFLTSVAGLRRSVVNVSTLTWFTSYIFYSFIWNLELLNNVIYYIRLAASSDKAYQLLAHCRWFSLGNPAYSTTNTGRHDIAEILLKVALNTKANQSIIIY